MLPLIKLPSPGENITIKILEHAILDPRKLHKSFGEHVMKCYSNEKEYYLELRPFIIKEFLKECKKYNIPIEEDFNGLVGKEITIFGKSLDNAPKRLWHMNETKNKLEPPIVHNIKLKI